MERSQLKVIFLVIATLLLAAFLQYAETETATGKAFFFWDDDEEQEHVVVNKGGFRSFSSTGRSIPYVPPERDTKIREPSQVTEQPIITRPDVSEHTSFRIRDLEVGGTIREYSGTIRNIHVDDLFEAESGEDVVFVEDNEDETLHKIRGITPDSSLVDASVVLRAVDDLGALNFEERPYITGRSGTGYHLVSSPSQSSGLGGSGQVKDVLVLLMNFHDDRSEPYSRADVREILFDGRFSSNEFYKDMSNNNLQLRGRVLGYYESPFSRNDCGDDYRWWMNWAVRQARSSVDTGDYDHFVLFFPYTHGCTVERGTWTGLAVMNGKHVWINGDFSSHQTVSHELGHNFGLSHSNGLDCGQNYLSASCENVEYGAQYDSMGNNDPSSYFNYVQQERFGWMSRNDLLEVTSSGTYTIDSALHADSSGSVKGLLVHGWAQEGEARGPIYIFEHRRPREGFDTLLNALATRGATVYVSRAQTGFYPEPFRMLDMSPDATSTSSWDFADGSMFDGMILRDPIHDVSIRQVSHDDESVTLAVQYQTDSSCVQGPPAIHVTGPYGLSATQSSFRTYVLVHNNNPSVDHEGSRCPSSSFSINVDAPAGVIPEWTNQLAIIYPGTTSRFKLDFEYNYNNESPLINWTAAPFPSTGPPATFSVRLNSESSVPRLESISPSPNSLVNCLTNIEATYGNEETVSKVELIRLSDQVVLGSDTEPPFIFPVDFTRYGMVTWSDIFQLNATNFRGNTVDTFKYNINNELARGTPTVLINEPLTNDELIGVANLHVEAFDDCKIESVKFYVDDELITTLYEPPYVHPWETYLHPNGWHTVKFVATNNFGVNRTQTVNVELSNSYEGEDNEDFPGDPRF